MAVRPPSSILDYGPPSSRRRAWVAWLWRAGRYLAVSLLTLAALVGVLLLIVAAAVAGAPDKSNVWRGVRMAYSDRRAPIEQRMVLSVDHGRLKWDVDAYQVVLLPNGQPLVPELNPLQNFFLRGHRKFVNRPPPLPMFDRWGVRYENYLVHQDRDWFWTATRFMIHPLSILAGGLLLLLPLALNVMRRMRKAWRH